MMIVLWTTLTLAAGPDAPFARIGDEIKVRRYDRVTKVPPIRARWRRRSGTVEAWVFPDGVVEHFRRYKRRKVVSEHRFDSAGAPLTSVALGDNGPTEVMVHGPDDQAIEVSGWVSHELAERVFLLPVPPSETNDNGASWTLEDGTFTVEQVESANPFDDTFRDDLVATCGCRLIDRATAFIDGRPAARYRFRLPDVNAPEEGHLWALPVSAEQGAPLLLMLWRTQVGPNPESNLALGRAMIALIKAKEKP